MISTTEFVAKGMAGTIAQQSSQEHQLSCQLGWDSSSASSLLHALR